MPDHFCIVSDHAKLKFSFGRHNVSPAADSYNWPCIGQDKGLGVTHPVAKIADGYRLKLQCYREKKIAWKMANYMKFGYKSTFTPACMDIPTCACKWSEGME